MGLWRALGSVCMIVLLVLRIRVAAASSMAAAGLAVVAGRTAASTSGPHHQRVRRMKGCAVAAPPSGKVAPADHGGGRHLAGVAQDRDPLGQGRQAPVLEDAGWPPALPGGGDPPAGRGAPGAADGLTWSGSAGELWRPTSPLADAWVRSDRHGGAGGAEGGLADLHGPLKFSGGRPGRPGRHLQPAPFGRKGYVTKGTQRPCRRAQPC